MRAQWSPVFGLRFQTPVTILDKLGLKTFDTSFGGDLKKIREVIVNIKKYYDDIMRFVKGKIVLKNNISNKSVFNIHWIA